jgi:predicted transcriptional regulator
MTSDRIGMAAGVLWKKIHDKGGTGVSFTEVKKLTGFTPDEAAAAIGWLAREGKLAFATEGKKQVVRLSEQACCV